MHKRRQPNAEWKTQSNKIQHSLRWETRWRINIYLNISLKLIYQEELKELLNVFWNSKWIRLLVAQGDPSDIINQLPFYFGCFYFLVFISLRELPIILNRIIWQEKKLFLILNFGELSLLWLWMELPIVYNLWNLWLRLWKEKYQEIIKPIMIFKLFGIFKIDLIK